MIKEQEGLAEQEHNIDASYAEHLESMVDIDQPKYFFREVDGDLITLALLGNFDIIGQGCNCFSTQGAGISGQFVKHFKSDKFYMEQDKVYMPYEKLGNFDYKFFALPNGFELTVLNIYSQYKPGRDFNPTAFELALFKINKAFKGQHIGLPLIGAGIAGGDWDRIKSIIQDTLVDMNVTIVHYDKK